MAHLNEFAGVAAVERREGIDGHGGGSSRSSGRMLGILQ
jgi:hypothetical protein